MAVYTEYEDVDPVGACVGTRGARVQAIVDELHGEKIDIITWSEDPAELIANVLSPAKVEKVIIDEENEKTATVVVPDYQLSLAIGKEGQNVRLAARVSGWKIDIKSHSQYEAMTGECQPEIIEVDEASDQMQTGHTDEISEVDSAVAAGENTEASEALEADQQ